MRPPRLTWFALAVTTVLLAIGAATASSSTAAQARPTTATWSPGKATTSAAGKVSIKYKIRRFGRRGHRLVAYGTAIARYVPGSAGGEASVARKAFRAPVKMHRPRSLSAQTICPILTLDLQQLDLNLLGLLVHADRVFLTLKADDAGGLLGKLLCGLASSGKLTTQAAKLTWLAKKSGLAVSGTGYSVFVQPPSGSGGSSNGGNATPTKTPLMLCPILELVLGPLDANLLGLLVHLDQVHLTLTADSDRGILGSLFCSVFNGGAATT